MEPDSDTVYVSSLYEYSVCVGRQDKSVTTRCEITSITVPHTRHESIYNRASAKLDIIRRVNTQFEHTSTISHNLVYEIQHHTMLLCIVTCNAFRQSSTPIISWHLMPESVVRRHKIWSMILSHSVKSSFLDRWDSAIYNVDHDWDGESDIFSTTNVFGAKEHTYFKHSEQ